MTPVEAYELYTALWSHFNSSYDFVKYNGKLKYAKSGFEKHRSKYYFQKLSKHPDPKGLVLSNLIVSTDIYITGLFVDEESHTIWKEWKKRQDALSYEFSQAVKILVYDDFHCIHSQHPNLLHLYLRGRFSIENMVILDDLIEFSEYWNKELQDPIWEETYNKMKKYKPFLSYDKEKMLEIFKKEFLSNQIS